MGVKAMVAGRDTETSEKVVDDAPNESCHGQASGESAIDGKRGNNGQSQS